MRLPLAGLASVLIPIALGAFDLGCVNLEKPEAVAACASSTTAPCANRGFGESEGDVDDAAVGDGLPGRDAEGDRTGLAPDAQAPGTDSAVMADLSPGAGSDTSPVGGPDARSETAKPGDARTGNDGAADTLVAAERGPEAPLGGPDAQAASPDASVGADSADLAGPADTLPVLPDTAGGSADTIPATPDLAPSGPEVGPDTTPASDARTLTVTFSAGRGVGTVMNGYGWVTVGSADTVSSPTCGANDAPITSANPCPANTNWDNTKALCVTGALPALSTSPTPAEYAANWGLQVGVNAREPLAPIGTTFQTIAVNITGSPTTGLRIELHRSGDAADATYCAVWSSGAKVLTSFNTKCWDGSGVALTAADVPTIDKVGVQVTSSTSAITVTSLCLESIVFGS
jgi:hypothetical protein